MVKGLAAVDWKKPENNGKLFAAVLAQFPGTPDYKKIAAIFGDNVPASAISYRLGVVRKEGGAMGFTAGPRTFSPASKTNGTTTTPKRTVSVVKKNGAKGKARAPGNMLNGVTSDDQDTAIDSEEESAMESDDDTNSTTPLHSTKRDKTISGRITKRASPRKGNKTNYKTLIDPFFTMDEAKDESGNNIFGEPSATESEDTYATDGSFREIGKKVAVKVEDTA